MRNDEVVAVLNAPGDLLEMKGENRFRVNAYRDTAQSTSRTGLRIAPNWLPATEIDRVSLATFGG